MVMNSFATSFSRQRVDAFLTGVYQWTHRFYFLILEQKGRGRERTRAREKMKQVFRLCFFQVGFCVESHRCSDSYRALCKFICIDCDCIEKWTNDEMIMKLNRVSIELSLFAFVKIHDLNKAHTQKRVERASADPLQLYFILFISKHNFINTNEAPKRFSFNEQWNH